MQMKVSNEILTAWEYVQLLVRDVVKGRLRGHEIFSDDLFWNMSKPIGQLKRKLNQCVRQFSVNIPRKLNLRRMYRRQTPR